ncbi:hypothetical protein [Zavarzinia compransoris]|uniref:Uncharacterized protein n=1 Tax=Zavarzinia compransoris TaxID=1264899 RepID=A0A317E671_9PROT|nr:hypothetical protein [Zavarzinia compransoris]PWR20525.1 hypothetical protein DKG75_10985 [Zavarzinia compransoris]TDP43830.1 hypothetical protein DES42_10986 [Zavarzinia compransoris]
MAASIASPRPLHRRHLLALALGAAAASLVRPRTAGAEAARDGSDTIGSIVILAPLNVSVVRKGKVRAIITLVPNIDVADEVLRGKLVREVPRIRDAYLRSLDPYVDRIDLKQAPNIARITEMLQRATDDLYGAGNTKVLITHATMRRTG